MRILANYGYRNNGDSYSVTFETMGDVPKENANNVVDELFALAKNAIQRQINPDADPLDFPPKEKETVTIPKLKKAESANGNGNGSASPATGGKKNVFEKLPLKDPTAPATGKQKSLIIHLAKERGQFVNGLNTFTMQMASEKIGELISVPA